MRLLLKAAIRFTIVGLSLLWCLASHAGLIWDWEIDNPSQVRSPTDIVPVFATLHNDVVSTVLLDGFERGPLEGIAIGSLVGDADFPPGLFEFDGGPLGEQTLQEQFFGAEIAPGESFSFVLYTLVPTAGAVPAGTYTIPVNDIALHGFGPGSGFKAGGAVEVIVVPEPASLGFVPLLTLGLLGLRRRQLRRLSLRSGLIAESPRDRSLSMGEDVPQHLRRFSARLCF